MADKYDEAVAYLKANPEEIEDAWHNPSTNGAGCLFSLCMGEDWVPANEIGKEMRLVSPAGEFDCGCLTQVRMGRARAGVFGPCSPMILTTYVAATAKLTREIRRDKRIPKRLEDVTVDDLPVFAEWQRRIDKELGRV